jgi:hypothetical protein
VKPNFCETLRHKVVFPDPEGPNAIIALGFISFVDFGKTPMLSRCRSTSAVIS